MCGDPWSSTRLSRRGKFPTTLPDRLQILGAGAASAETAQEHLKKAAGASKRAVDFSSGASVKTRNNHAVESLLE